MRPEREFFPVVVASPTEGPARHKHELEHKDESDLDLFVLNNKVKYKKPKKEPFYFKYPSYQKYCFIRDRVSVLLLN